MVGESRDGSVTQGDQPAIYPLGVMLARAGMSLICHGTAPDRRNAYAALGRFDLIFVISIAAIRRSKIYEHLSLQSIVFSSFNKSRA
jgi:hypothetical protein